MGQLIVFLAKVFVVDLLKALAEGVAKRWTSARERIKRRRRKDGPS